MCRQVVGIRSPEHHGKLIAKTVHPFHTKLWPKPRRHYNARLEPQPSQVERMTPSFTGSKELRELTVSTKMIETSDGILGW